MTCCRPGDVGDVLAAGLPSPPPVELQHLLEGRPVGGREGVRQQARHYLDGVVEHLFDLLPSGTYVTITADHGELFGEDGYVGHGPIQHDKVFEVPFVEGRLR